MIRNNATLSLVLLGCVLSMANLFVAPSLGAATLSTLWLYFLYQELRGVPG